MQGTKKTKGMLFKCSLIFILFAIVILAVTGVTTYYSQMNIYKRQCERNIRSIGEYLAALMENDWADVETYQDYYMAHCSEVEIPYDFDSYSEAAAAFTTLFSREYPGQTFGIDVAFEDLSEEAQRAYFIYRHEYWLLTFERAREAFDIPYSYYLVMKEDVHNVVYMIDGERTTPNDHLAEGETPDPAADNILYLGDEYYNDPAEYEIMWRTWETGEKQDGYQEFDNSWGHTYCYYTPLVIHGEKLGLIGTEINVARVNREILSNTLQQLFYIALIFVVGMALLLLLLNAFYIRRTRLLEQRVGEYAKSKDRALSERIEKEFDGGDELASLAHRFAAMIREVEEHMQSLMKATHELAVTQQHAAEMDDLANKDALTGVRNKTAYDREVQRIEKECAQKTAHFGVAMIDLNFLKRINDTYGHEKGDQAIVGLCRIICRVFEHSAVFRIGGDEFAVILMNEDYRYAESLVIEFERTIDETAADGTLAEWQRPSAAIGCAIYDPAVDDGYAPVFRRADSAMYERKRQMKAMRTH